MLARLTKIHRTGATGYIGGDAMFALYHAHTDWNFSTLVRNRDKVEKVQSLFPKLRIVQGDLNDAPLIEDEIKRADIIYRESFSQISFESVSLRMNILLTEEEQISPTPITSIVLYRSLVPSRSIAHRLRQSG